MVADPEPTRPASILVVDDTLENLQVLSRILKQRGYKVRPANNGQIALQSAQHEPPDLVLLDITMPGLDGYQVCQRLKADARLKHVPVIFISALSETLDKVRAFAVGGVDYITKPFQVEEVQARVATHLALRHLQESLEQQVAELDAFARTVAHDLKSPLTVITGYGVLLSKRLAKQQDETARQWLDDIVKTGFKMADIINGLLLLASVRKGGQIPLEFLDMTPIVTGVQERLAPLIAEHQAEILRPAAWPPAVGHAPWVEEVWANYISNAVKYGGRPPRVELGADAPSPGARLVRFWVRDNGAGLRPEEQARLFTEFTRLHHVQEGHGLGLSIVRRIVERLGGQVGVESAPGQGSLFYFTLPATLPNQPSGAVLTTG